MKALSAAGTRGVSARSRKPQSAASADSRIMPKLKSARWSGLRALIASEMVAARATAMIPSSLNKKAALKIGTTETESFPLPILLTATCSASTVSPANRPSNHQGTGPRAKPGTRPKIPAATTTVMKASTGAGTTRWRRVWFCWSAFADPEVVAVTEDFAAVLCSVLIEFRVTSFRKLHRGLPSSD